MSLSYGKLGLIILPLIGNVIENRNFKNFNYYFLFTNLLKNKAVLLFFFQSSCFSSNVWSLTLNFFSLSERFQRTNSLPRFVGVEFTNILRAAFARELNEK